LTASIFAGCNQVKKVPTEVSTTQTLQPSDSENTSVGRYIDYSDSAIAQATKDGGKAVLFFHAAWCPTCRAAEKEILGNLDTIPQDLTIIKTDFDSMQELKKQYQIVNQHTFVQVDADGNEVTRWVGGGLETILQRTEG
jgi:thiol-disulfide isomerase/thioredoxin